MNQLTAGSLFSGIGGIDLAFSLAGFNILFQVEIDDFCQKVLRKHGPTYWPNAEIHADVCSVGRRNLPPVDVLFGGFPCQSISNAGKREGLHPGTKSGLWFEFKRIIGEIRPGVVFLENVAAITHRDGIKVIRDLAEMGYDCKWGIVSAADSGAPHRRDRWWCVAFNVGHASGVGHGRSAATEELYDHQKRHNPPYQQQGAAIIHAPLAGGEMGNPNGQQRKEQHTTAVADDARFVSGRDAVSWAERGRVADQSRMDRAVDGVSTRMDGHHLMTHRWPVGPSAPQLSHEAPRMAPGNEHTIDRIRALGNAVVPQCVYPMAVEIAAFLGGG